MRRLAAFALGTLALVSLPSALRAQNDPALASRIDRIINRPEFKHAMWGIEVFDLDAGRPIYALNEEKLFVPGSTTKLLSAGTALAKLGADHRFRTHVYRTGPVESDGTLRGDLVLVASGDPNLSQRRQPDGSLAFENHDHSYGGAPDTKAVPGDPLIVLKTMAAQVAEKGVKRVTGRVIVDASLFAEGTRELGSGVVVSPISVNDNVLDVTIAPGTAVGAPVRLTVSPPNSYVRFVNRATTSAAAGEPTIDTDPGTTDSDGVVTVTVTGTYPAAMPERLYAYPVPVPSRFAAVTFAEALRSRGVAANAAPAGAVIDLAELARHYVGGNVVAEHISAPASEMVKVILKVSQNMHASAMPMLMGALFAKAPGETGFDVEREWLQREGLDTRGAQQGDGAGGDAHFTPAFMVSYLRMMSKRHDFPKFRAALPILGRDGTLSNIQPQSPAAGRVFAKTGTYAVGDPLNRLLLVTGKGLAGYMTTASGKNLIVVVYANNVAVSLAPDETTRVVGQALGEVAAAAWDY
ncbi:MAG: D-alanyl-D-alanine carboxypeptidase/D-alanyl-D-alanine-endopeptidase [Gemmatimonadetes bacterium]|nr:D-alanyl-D-alanine carboxypeptidase/D-alanyl-D-alanine-endopeptidase [Gemmatimonadota bacterium]